MDAPAQDDVCDNRLRPISGNLGYGWRKPGALCEGLYQAPVTATGLDVVSLLRGKLRFDLDRDRQLRVSAPDLSGLASGPVRVRAVALPLKTYYRMDATLPADHALVWPVGEVLYPARLNADRIGVFGWVGSETDKTFVPLMVVPKEGGTAPAIGAPLELMVRSPVELDKLVWRTSLEDERITGPLTWQDAGAGPVRAGQVVTVMLPARAAAVLRVDIAAKRTDTDKWLTLTLRVKVPRG